MEVDNLKRRSGPLLRNPDAQYPVGVLSEIGDVEVVAVRHTPDLPGFAEDSSNPVVYAVCAGRGRKTPADLFYLHRNPSRPDHGFRVYIREVQEVDIVTAPTIVPAEGGGEV